MSTDFFRVELQKQRHSMKREHREASMLGKLIMPSTVTFQATEALVKFAYTGRLDAEPASSNFQVLQKTAKLLGMVGAVNALDKLNQRLGNIAEEKKKASGNATSHKSNGTTKEVKGCSCSCSQAGCHQLTNQNGPTQANSLQPSKEAARHHRGKQPPATKTKPPRSLPSARNLEPVFLQFWLVFNIILINIFIISFRLRH